MANGRKTRADRWDAKAGLTDEQVWRAFDVFGRSKWAEFLAWAERELAGVRIPSRNSMYEWHADMAEKESAHRLRQSRETREEIGRLAETAALDGTLVAAYKSMGAKAALLGNKSEALALTKMAIALADRQVEAAKLERELAAERRARAAEAQAEALRKEVAGLKAALSEAGKTNAADPAAVAAEVDKLLGRKPQ